MRFTTTSTAALLLAATLSGAAHAEDQGPALIAANCGSCHDREADGGFVRISRIRKTPEGWDMTISRMQRWHGVKITPDDRAALVKYLSDLQGLAPSEAEPFRYVLEQRPGVEDKPVDADLGDMCARCHTIARPGLQRRDADEWKKLVSTHVGQWPTLEFQAKSRDRDWWGIANSRTKDQLGKLWGFASSDWDQWKGHKAPDLDGAWAVSGHQPGKGDYLGVLTVKKETPDHYSVDYDLTFADGAHVSAQGKSVLYTGYEWRGALEIDGKSIHEVYALSADGQTLSGRWFDGVNDEIGADQRAVKLGKTAVLQAVEPQAVKAGGPVKISLIGAALNGPVNLGPGVKVGNIEQKPWGLEVSAEIAADTSGVRDVTAGGARLPQALAIYDKVAAVTVEPPFTIARIGDNGGATPRHAAQFEAIGYANDKEGKPTIRLGALPARWSSDNFNEAAKALDDVKFAGSIDEHGLFTPGPAGPNPQRVFQTNNVGDLKINAVVADGKGGAVSGDGHLIVTVQRWVDGWIR